MAIYTLFGSEIEILGGNHLTGEVEIRYIQQGHVITTTIQKLKADNGIIEIHKAIETTKHKTREGK